MSINLINMDRDRILKKSINSLPQLLICANVYTMMLYSISNLKNTIYCHLNFVVSIVQLLNE